MEKDVKGVHTPPQAEPRLHAHTPLSPPTLKLSGEYSAFLPPFVERQSLSLKIGSPQQLEQASVDDDGGTVRREPREIEFLSLLHPCGRDTQPSVGSANHHEQRDSNSVGAEPRRTAFFIPPVSKKNEGVGGHGEGGLCQVGKHTVLRARGGGVSLSREDEVARAVAALYIQQQQQQQQQQKQQAMGDQLQKLHHNLKVETRASKVAQFQHLHSTNMQQHHVQGEREEQEQEAHQYLVQQLQQQQQEQLQQQLLQQQQQQQFAWWWYLYSQAAQLHSPSSSSIPLVLSEQHQQPQPWFGHLGQEQRNVLEDMRLRYIQQQQQQSTGGHHGGPNMRGELGVLPQYAPASSCGTDSWLPATPGRSARSLPEPPEAVLKQSYAFVAPRGRETLLCREPQDFLLDSALKRERDALSEQQAVPEPDTPGDSKRCRRHNSEKKVCSNCHTSTTPFWRKDKQDGRPLCNACGLYFAKNDAARPKMLWKRGEDC